MSSAAGQGMSNLLSVQYVSGTEATVVVLKSSGRFCVQATEFAALWVLTEESCAPDSTSTLVLAAKATQRVRSLFSSLSRTACRCTTTSPSSTTTSSCGGTWMSCGRIWQIGRSSTASSRSACSCDSKIAILRL
ncbi:unnamed protein product [Effrenium voratum]|uniref:PTHB1 platform domain-containing protein n=1 Tax=Effrenium voratum TaxID=2562239 RepID=A0AA36N6M1_9DINO|nr:unnamed protein product [Effrenium voratum]